MTLNRRQVLSAAVASLLRGQEPGLPPAYAESAALDAFTPDATDEIAIRLGRFPRRGDATLWVTVCLGDKVYSAALENLKLGSFKGRTPVETEKATFAVLGDGEAHMTRTRNAGLLGSARVTAGAHESAEPPPGAGPVRIRIDANFESGHHPVQARPGRMEVMGHAEAVIHVAGRVSRIRGHGKWHEQVGDRPRFAPAFTYLNVIGDRTGLLAVWRKAGAYGYAWIEDKIVAVKTAQFDPIAARRKFRVELENGTVIDGETVTHRVVSVPIEGRQRPGATVLVTSSIGPMTGHLNDWDPKD
ncbi:MAG: hypothetical protein LAP38_12010 [Acidobacteriia bacterium]|nr:hypothetical protein [Terriglobia bacterium]